MMAASRLTISVVPEPFIPRDAATRIADKDVEHRGPHGARKNLRGLVTTTDPQRFKRWRKE